MAKFDRQIETALRLIKKNGQLVNWTSQTGESLPDPTKPWLPVGTTPVIYTPHICFLPLDLQGKEFLFSLNGSEAVTGTYYGLMGNVNFEPNTSDIIVRDGIILDINSIDLLSPNGQKILYTIIFNG